MTSPGSRICLACDAASAGPMCGTCGAATVSLPSIHAGEQSLVGKRLVEKYDIIGVLGRGGMGVVYKGVQISMQRPVAVKVLSPGGPDPVMVLKRFERETRITSRLTHPNTVRVFDNGVTQDGMMFLVMELLEGRELATEIKLRGSLPLAQAVDITVQVLRALKEAHGLGIIHRDLKPPNIFLQQVTGGEVTVKVMDFGIARILEEEHAPTVTVAGQLVGSPTYMAPEQIEGGATSARSDIYSLGVILFEMLAGKPPFQAESLTGVMIKHVSEPAPDIGVVIPSLANHRTLRDLVASMLAKSPDARPQDAAAMLNLLAGLPAHGHHPGVMGSAKAPHLPLPGEELRLDVSSQPTVARVNGVEEPTAQRPQDAVGAAALALAAPHFEKALSTAPGEEGSNKPTGAALLGYAAGAALLVVGLGMGMGFLGRVGRVEGGTTETAALTPAPTTAAATVTAVGGDAVAAPQAASQDVTGVTAPPAVIHNPASSFAPSRSATPRVTAQLDSVPKGAQVWLAGKVVGTTPCSVALENPTGAVDIKMTKTGFNAYSGQRSPAQLEAGVRVTLTALASPAENTKSQASKPTQGKHKSKMTDRQLLEDF